MISPFSLATSTFPFPSTSSSLSQARPLLPRVHSPFQNSNVRTSLSLYLSSWFASFWWLCVVVCFSRMSSRRFPKERASARRGKDSPISQLDDLSFPPSFSSQLPLPFPAMAPKSKSLFRQPGVQHYQLVHRSQRDPLINDPDAGGRVLKSLENPNRKVSQLALSLSFLLLLLLLLGLPRQRGYTSFD